MQADIKSLRQCIYCHNFCKFSCPSYIASKDQKILQTQRNYLIHLYDDRKIELDKELGRSIYYCNDCRRCENYCIYDEKDVLANNRYSKEVIFKKGLAPEKVYEIEKNLKKHNNVFGLDLSKEEENEDYFSKEYDIFIYSGDIVKYLEPQIYSSFVRILKVLGISYISDEGEISDGMLALDLGIPELSNDLMKKNFERISNFRFKKIVILSPESYYGFKMEYGKFGYKFGKDMVHYTEFVNDYIDDIKVNKTNDKIKYFDPCKLGRYLGIYKEPRNILSKLFGIEDFEFFKNKEESKCCGGYVSLYDKEFSNKVSMELINECKEAGCNVLITSCPLCVNNLKSADLNKEIKIYDLLEYISVNLEE